MMNSRIYWASNVARRGLGFLLPSRRALRLCAYFSVVSALGVLLVARALYAATREDAFGIGHELLGLAALTGGAESVQLNGERFHHAVAATTEPLPTVLDRLEQHCLRNPGPAARVIDQLATHDGP